MGLQIFLNLIGNEKSWGQTPEKIAAKIDRIHRELNPIPKSKKETVDVTFTEEYTTVPNQKEAADSAVLARLESLVNHEKAVQCELNLLEMPLKESTADVIRCTGDKTEPYTYAEMAKSRNLVVASQDKELLYLSALTFLQLNKTPQKRLTLVRLWRESGTTPYEEIAISSQFNAILEQYAPGNNETEIVLLYLYAGSNATFRKSRLELPKPKEFPTTLRKFTKVSQLISGKRPAPDAMTNADCVVLFDFDTMFTAGGDTDARFQDLVAKPTQPNREQSGGAAGLRAATK